MRPDEDPRAWLEKASADFNFASQTLPDTTFYAQICFFFQQSAEKYLKAYVVAKKLSFKKIHDLTELARLCQEDESKFQELFEDCNFLTDYYIDTRYPVHWPAQVTKEEAQKAEAAARGIKEFIETLLQV